MCCFGKLTDGVELNAAVSQVLRVENNIILGLSVGYQDSDFAGFWAHPNVGSEVVLEDVVKSHSCASETKTQLLLLGTRASPPLIINTVIAKGKQSNWEQNNQVNIQHILA